ncbi:hypothetical protein PLEOSDRAFT_153777 [Pleurotus ostreatus PC15]|uniref:Fungal-type protein kinase domain-containing protein n=1 Tax=Pleurotus ostreatus (strain PC15) TaxID=1137138 RepID=A0A067NZX3_PLEO1|nr:hypothetical protein PLEOSDRAFT_153777 [Pleurotus ostreatus PC15]
MPAKPDVFSPVSVEESVAQTKGVMRDMGRETKGSWIGPCPVENFFENIHISENDELTTQPGIPATYLQGMHVSCANDLCKTLNTLINGAADYASPLPDYFMVDAFNHIDCVEDRAQIWPSSGCIEKGLVSKGTPKVVDLVVIACQGKSTDIVDDTMECTKPLPHDDCQAPYELIDTASTLIRGRLANYATQLSRSQHRTHIYMVYIFHPFVRFVRWDRSGAVVTKRVNYMKNSTPLMRFLYLFGRSDKAGRGFDCTVQHATPAEAVIAKEYLKRWAPRMTHPVCKMNVPSIDGGDFRQFLVWNTLAEPESLFGRATRGYPAVELINGVVSQKPMFLKDQWRDAEGRSEVETLLKLNKKTVEHVPTLVCGGDLPGQETRTHEIGDGDRRVGHNRIDRRVHTRFVVAEVGQPLEHFPSSKAMLSAVYDAFKGHRQAYERCNILHQDISGGNILIVDDNGLLSDWDLAEDASEGTWTFMSAALLQEPYKQHTIRDDLESFFWVVLYHGLHFVPHSLFQAIEAITTSIFDYYDFTALDGIARGGVVKIGLISHNSYIGRRSRPELTFTSCPPLTDFIFQAAATLKQWSRRYDPTIEDLGDDRECIPVTHADMEGIWTQALQSPLWPVNDRAIDQLRHAKTLNVILHGERLEANLKRSEPHEPADYTDEDGYPRRKRRKTCHG